jgi:hypothetical protein
MTTRLFHTADELRSTGVYDALMAYLAGVPRASFFQSPGFLELLNGVRGFDPVLVVAMDQAGHVHGCLAGTYQRDGGPLKAWFSRRLIVYGGPVAGPEAVPHLLAALLRHARGRAIYVEVRNFFDTTAERAAFEAAGFTYTAHLNYILDLGGEEDTLKRLGNNRRRQIRDGLAAGATVGEAANDQEVADWYALLDTLYREKVRKPLPGLDLFHALHRSPHGRVFVVRHKGRVIGGSAGPVDAWGNVFQWYVCGSPEPGVDAGVLAVWAQISYGARNGYQRYDFMGAGKPEEPYGVRTFKARFKGTEVCHGRYQRILSPGLFRLGKLGLTLLGRLRGRSAGPNE